MNLCIGKFWHNNLYITTVKVFCLGVISKTRSEKTSSKLEPGNSGERKADNGHTTSGVKAGGYFILLKKVIMQINPQKPEKDIPAKPDHNPDPTKPSPANDPAKVDPTRIEEPGQNDPTRIDNPPPFNPQIPSVPPQEEQEILKKFF